MDPISLPYGVGDLDPDVVVHPDDPDLVRCYVRGCRHFVRRPTRRQRGQLCPEHGIYCHHSRYGSTYSHADVRRNIIASPDLFVQRIVGHPFKFESHRLGSENSEDALSWNVFRSQQEAACLAQVAIQLYDMLEDHHRLPSRFRTVLWAGAMLHDIGTDERLAELPGEHGWRSADFIRRSPDQFDCNLANSDEIAMLAALHSAAGGGDDPVLGEVPDWLSQRFGELPKELRWLVAILRVADGLDRGLDQTVAEVTAVDLTNHRILVRADSADVGNNIDRANQKADLLRRVLGCPQLRVERSS